MYYMQPKFDLIQWVESKAGFRLYGIGQNKRKEERLYVWFSTQEDAALIFINLDRFSKVITIKGCKDK